MITYVHVYKYVLTVLIFYIYTSFSHLPSNTEVFVSRGREEQFLWGTSASTAWIFSGADQPEVILGTIWLFNGRYNDS